MATNELWGADGAGDAANVLGMPLAAQFDAVPGDWKALTEPFRQGTTGQSLLARVEARRQSGAIIHPGDVFAALRLTPLAEVRAVILGQDPYHGPGQAHGLAFSVRPGVKPPPSLRNIFKEWSQDLDRPRPPHGDLSAWARRGVLLLNTSLTVEAGQAASHAGWGWEALTDALIHAVSTRARPTVFMLWGAHAWRRRSLIAGQGHLVLQCNHPSPLSASRGPVPFLGCRHFSQAETFLGQDIFVFD